MGCLTGFERINPGKVLSEQQLMFYWDTNGQEYIYGSVDMFDYWLVI